MFPLKNFETLRRSGEVETDNSLTQIQRSGRAVQCSGHSLPLPLLLCGTDSDYSHVRTV